MLTEKETSCIWKACDEYKKIVSQPGPDTMPGLLDKWSVSDFYNTVIDNEEEFKNDILNHPIFADKNYESLCDVYHNERYLFMYCLQTFLSKKLLFSFVEITPGIPKTTTDTDTTAKPIDITWDEETENKKEFIKEVMEGVEKKKTLKDFLTDPRSYKQWRDDVERCLLYTDWERIHRVMKKLKWKWRSWIDNEYNEHTNTVPSVFGIRENVSDRIKKMEEWIMNHPDEEEYFTSSGGFEIEMRIYDDEVDDYDHRVKFVVRFVVEQFDNSL